MSSATDTLSRLNSYKINWDRPIRLDKELNR